MKLMRSMKQIAGLHKIRENNASSTWFHNGVGEIQVCISAYNHGSDHEDGAGYHRFRELFEP